MEKPKIRASAASIFFRIGARPSLTAHRPCLLPPLVFTRKATRAPGNLQIIQMDGFGFSPPRGGSFTGFLQQGGRIPIFLGLPLIMISDDEIL